MQFIPTTATTVQKIKSAAKAISRETGTSYTMALEDVAKARGYEGWFHVQQCQKTPPAPKANTKPLTCDETAFEYSQFLAQQKRATVERLPVSGNVFYDITIEGQRFVGKVMEIGEVRMFKHLNGLSEDFSPSIEIGTASIRKIDANLIQTKSQSGVNAIFDNVSNPEPYGDWWICKYDPEQNRIDLGAMTIQGRNALAYEFGLPLIERTGLPKVGYPHYSFMNGGEDALFYKSPAYQALLVWAKSNSRAARQSNKHSIHLKNWLDRDSSAASARNTMG